MDRLQRSALVMACAWLILLFLFLPALIVIPVSFTDTRYLALPQDHWSLQHWRHLLTDPRWRDSMATSLAIASAATALAVVAGTLCALGCWRIAGRWGERIRLAMLVPLVVPTIVYALGIYRVLVTLHLLGTPAGVVLAHAVTGLPFVVLTVSASLAGLDARIEQAARGLGASPTQAVRLVIIPNILPGVLSGAIFAFVHSWDELILVIFIAGRLFTLPRMMWDGINDNLDPTIAVVATSLILFTMLALLAQMRRQQREIK